MGSFRTDGSFAVFVQGGPSIFRPCVSRRKRRTRKNKGRGWDQHFRAKSSQAAKTLGISTTRKTVHTRSAKQRRRIAPWTGAMRRRRETTTKNLNRALVVPFMNRDAAVAGGGPYLRICTADTQHTVPAFGNLFRSVTGAGLAGKMDIV